jgi:hypothetical protein
MSAPKKNLITAEVTYGVMARLKSTNEDRHMRIERSHNMIKAAEAMVLANPTVEPLKRLLLQQMSILCKAKNVGQFEKRDCVWNPDTKAYEYPLDKKGQPIELWIVVAEAERIKDDADWMVSIVKGGKDVRIHYTPEANKRMLKQLEDKCKGNVNMRNPKVYE